VAGYGGLDPYFAEVIYGYEISDFYGFLISREPLRSRREN